MFMLRYSSTVTLLLYYIITLSNIDVNYEIQIGHAKIIPLFRCYSIFGTLNLWYDIHHQIKII